MNQEYNGTTTEIVEGETYTALQENRELQQHKTSLLKTEIRNDVQHELHPNLFSMFKLNPEVAESI